MPSLLTRVGLAARALFSSPAVTALALERAAMKELVGTFPRDMDARVAGMLGGVFPGSRGEPPPRGTADYLRAYSTMPWLRAVSDRTAYGSAAAVWQVKALRGKNGKYFRDPLLQRADHPTRQKMLAAHKAAGAEPVELLDHPLRTVLHGGNDMMTGLSVRALTQLYLDLVGESFMLKQRNAAGAPVGLWPLPPHWVRETPTPASPRYKLQVNAWQDDIPDTEVLWLKRPDPFNPYGRGSGMTQALGDELQTDEYSAKMTLARMYNQARPDIIVSPKEASGPELKEDQVKRLERAWLQKYRGFLKVALPHFSSKPIDVKVISQNFEELQLVPLRQFERDTIISVYGIPPEKMAVLTSSNRATIDAADLIFAKDVLVPRLEFQREHYQERLVPEYDERLIVDYVSPVAEDKDRQAEARKVAPYTVRANEWRDAQGLEPDERLGDGYYLPFNVTFSEDPTEAAPSSASVGSGNGSGAVDGGDKGAADPITAIAKAALALAKRSVFRAGQYDAKAIAQDDDYYTLVHRVADRLAPKLRRQFLETISKIRDSVVLHDLQNALTSGQLAAAMATIPWTRLEAELNGGTEIIRQALFAAADASATELGEALGVTLRFDRTNPAALAWAQQNAARYVTEVSGATKEAINELIVAAFEEQRSPQETSRFIRDVIGLHSRQVAAVEKFRARLLEDGVDGEGLERRVAKYASAQLNKRATLIARTELLDASNAGQQLLWLDAQRNGLLDYDRVRRRALTTADDRLDEITCEPMPYMDENQDVHLDEDFTTGDGTKKRSPTYHPGCRCAVGLEFLK